MKLERVLDDGVMAMVALRQAALDEPDRARKAWRELLRVLRVLGLLIFVQPRMSRTALA